MNNNTENKTKQPIATNRKKNVLYNGNDSAQAQRWQTVHCVWCFLLCEQSNALYYMPECPKFEKNSFIFIMLVENVWGRAWIQRTRKLLEMLIFYYVYVHVWFCLFQQNSYVIHTNTLTITIKIGHIIVVYATNTHTHTPMQAILLIHQLHCIHIEYSSKPNEQMYIIIFHIQGWFHVDQLFSFSTSNFNSRLCYNSKLNSNLFHTKYKLPSFSTWDNGTMKIYWNLQLNSTKV